MASRKRAIAPELVEEGKDFVTVTVTCAAAGNYTAGDILSASATGDAGLATEIELGETYAVREIAQIVAKCSEDSVAFRPRYNLYRESPGAADVEMDDNAAGDFAKTSTGRDAFICSIVGSAFSDRGTAMATSESDIVNKLIRTKSGSSKVYLVLETLDDEANETAAMTIVIDIYFK